MIALNLQRFGGRGGKAGGVSGGSYKSVDELTPVPMDEAIGQKGQPDTLNTAADRTNRRFYAADGYTPGTDEMYQVNCQRCVVAQELRQRGYNVEARPSTGERDPMPYMLGRQSWTKSFIGMKDVRMDAANPVQAIANQMAAYGDGARAIVSFGRSGGSGHVFTAEQINGRTYFVDPQTGRAHDGQQILRSARAGSVRVWRVDNLEMNPDIIGLAVRQAT